MKVVTRLLRLLPVVIALALASACLHAEDRPPAAAFQPAEKPPAITIRLVSDHASGKLVSDLEQLQPVVKTIFDKTGTQTLKIGERATLWVRNAQVDGKFFFERFYQGKYINRNSELQLDPNELGPGEHAIQPGDHRFTLAEDGSLSSSDPEIRIEGRTLSLKMHRITILPVDGSRGGPPEYRLIATQLGLYALGPELRVSSEHLPDAGKSVSDGPLELEALARKDALVNLLSHARTFYPLSVYLPSNRVGQGYVLYPSWQAFHVTPEGQAIAESNLAPRVPGISFENFQILIPYRTFHAKVLSATGLKAAVGHEFISKGGSLTFSPTLEAIRFTAGLGKPDEAFSMPVDNDLSKNPNKYFLADNTTKDPQAVRLLALEWGHPVFTRGQEVKMFLRFLEAKPTLVQPTARVSFSPFNPESPGERIWREIETLEWRDGQLSFRLPQDVEYNFYYFRVIVLDASDPSTWSPLSSEFFACIIGNGQTGTASFISNKGRNAFRTGEDIRLQAVVRSQAERAPGSLTVRLKHPDGRDERYPFRDAGGRWHAQPILLKASMTRQLPPGRYTLTFPVLPETIAAFPFYFDLVPQQKKSLFHIVKPSKYTDPMSSLVTSWAGSEPYPLERAVASLAELGYNRIDHMAYTTDLQSRYYTGREDLASTDDRLMAPESVYMPSPRNHLLNACVRHGLEFSDVLLSYNDFHLPRYIPGYIEASKRWIKREMASMRHSPALAGMFLYDEMYQTAAVGFPDQHPNQFAKIRDLAARDALGRAPAEIIAIFSRYLAKPKNQRDPEALQEFLRYRHWELHGWGDYNTQVANAAREVAPVSKIGTYHRTWMIAGQGTGVYNGYPPDVFENLDILSCIHYADNSTGWVHSSMMANALRFGPRRTLFINIPLTHEGNTMWDGQYQRHMAFAVMAQGADGVSMYGLHQRGHEPSFFTDGPNPEMLTAKETTRYLNREILAPLGEIISRTESGYQKIGIVATENQHILSEFKKIPFSTQIEELWVACWRLGYPATFLCEDAFEGSLEKFQVIFVPGVRFEGELPPKIIERLKEALRAGCKVVVEKDSELALPGILKLDDMPLSQFFLGQYFPTWYDDELNKVFEKSQITTDYLSKKLPEWVEPAARGPFKVGPHWRSSGVINYLVMANFDDPEYNHTIKQIMAKPVRMPLRVPAHRGKAAYDLLAQRPIPLALQGEEAAFDADMSRVEGAFMAFLPEPINKLSVTCDGGDPYVHLMASLIGDSGQALTGVFPARVRLMGPRGEVQQEYYRVLGQDIPFILDMPGPQSAGTDYSLEVRESISGKTCRIHIGRRVLSLPTLSFEDEKLPFVPYPEEVNKFLRSNASVMILWGHGITGPESMALELAADLKKRGIAATVKNEMDAFRYPEGDTSLIDPMSDGFHSWRTGFEVIQPVTVVDSPVILLGGKSASYLLEGLNVNGYLTEAPQGGQDLPTRPTIQVAPRGLHWKYDTLCIVANDLAGMRAAVKQVAGDLPKPPVPGVTPGAGPARPPAESVDETSAPAATSFLTSNEFILDLKFDRAGNIYVITWGHGNNLYSIEPNGKLRFARYLPEMGASRLDVYEDRVLVYTAAGARLYQLTLGGQPISQIRLTMDPGSTIQRDGYGLCSTPYEYLPATRQILHNNQPISSSKEGSQKSGSMRIIDEKGDIAVEWIGETYQDKEVSDRIVHRGLEGYAFSPDRTHIAQVETSMYFTQKSTYEDRQVFDSHLVIRDLSGKLLHEYKNVANDTIGEVRWLPGAAGPAVIAKGEIWQFDESLKLLFTEIYNSGLFRLPGQMRLVADGHSLRLLDGRSAELARFGPFSILPTLAALSPDEKKIAFLDEYSRLAVYEADTGKPISNFKVPQLGQALRFAPDSNSLLLGGIRGLLMNFGLDGKPLWETSLSASNDPSAPGKLYDPSFQDLTATLWPEKRDEPGDLDALVKMDADRLVNGDCERNEGWEGQANPYFKEGFNSSQSLRVGPATVSQNVTRFLGNHTTWVLEFFYKTAPGCPPATLLAGLLVESKYPDSVARTFLSSEQWHLARIAFKSGMQPRRIKVGFNAREGEALVDSIRLRSIRFPSINHLFYEPLHQVKPVVLTNALFASDYNPVGSLRDDSPNRIIVEGIGSQVGPDVTHVEPAFLQNGRLNDIGSTWYIQPLGHDTNISIGLKEARWVSLVALYFNAYDEANITPHFDIYAVDVDSKQERLAASIRHNKQLFRLLKFPPVKTPQINIRLVNAIKRLRTLTEVEIYGPLSGKEGVSGFADPEGQNTYMGDFARVDKRKKNLAKAYNAAVRRHNHGEGWDILWGPAISQILVSEGKIFVSNALGFNEMYTLEKPTETQSRARAGGLGFSPYVTLYGGLLLKPGIDGKLYCIDADSSRELWSVKLGDRLQGSPVAIAEDLFAASDTGKLYKLDLANGSILMEQEISGGVSGSLATDGENLLMITADGFLQNFEPQTARRRWAAPVAADTESTPAIDGGIVYLADQKGKASAVDAKTGNGLWAADLGQEFRRCPVVTDSHVLFGCARGKLAVLRRSDGQALWSVQTKSRFDYEPLVLEGKALYFDDCKGMLLSLSDGAQEEAKIGIEDDPIAPISYHQGKLFVIPRHGDRGHGVLWTNHPWHVVGGMFYVFSP